MIIKKACLDPFFRTPKKKRFVPFEKIFSLQKILRKVIDSLPPEDQISLSLYYQEGLSFEEIGEVLSRGPGEVGKEFNEIMERVVKQLYFLQTSLN